ncbi:MAG: DUF3857 domain-containing protein [Victivallaceae bacterium]
MKRFFLLLLLILTASLSAAPEFPLPALLERAARATVEVYPDADSVLLYDLQQAVYQTDGSGKTRDDYFQKVLTEKARRELRSLPLGFDAFYEKLEVVKLEVIRPDGKVIPVDVAQNAKVAVDSSQMEENIYDPNQKVLTVSIPDLEVGDVIHIVVENTIVRPRIPGVWCDITMLQSDVPIVEYIVEIDAPATRPLASRLIKDEVPGTVRSEVSEAGGRILYRWVASNVPMVIPEPGMPPVYTCAQRLLASTLPDWPAVSRWYYELCRPHLDAVSPELKAKVAELIAGAKTPEEKIGRLFQFVSQQIRYMGLTPEQEAPGYEPHDVSLTFANRYGVCRDKAALLAAMLKLAKFEAFPTLCYVGPLKDEEVPNNYFNHAIVAVELTPGEYVLMDPTNETTTELLPAGLAEKSYLVARRDGDKLRTSPPVPSSRNALKIRLDGAIGDDGNLSCRATLDFAGVNDQAYRDAFSRWPEEMRRQFFANRLKTAVPGSELETLTIEPADVRDMDKPLRAEFTFSVPGAIRRDGVFPLDPPDLTGAFGVVNNFLGGATLDVRKFPLEIYSTCEVDETMTLKLPAYLKAASLPEREIKLTSPAFDLSRQLEFKNGVLEVSSRIALKQTRISPAAYAALKETLREAEAALRAYPLFTVGDPLAAWPRADAAYLRFDRTVTFTAPDACTQVEKVELRVNNYAGVKRYSELSVPFNPATSEVTLGDAEVRRPDGTVQVLAAGEINVMDAPWNGSAPRYPGGKILVANFPGVKPGAVISYTLTRRFFKLDSLSFTPVFAATVPILAQRFTLENPAGLQLAVTALGGEVTQQGNVWSTAAVAPVRQEPGMAPLAFFKPSFRISADNFKAFGTKLNDALLKKCENQPAAAAKAQELAGKIGDERGKIQAIRDFVAKNIRETPPGLHAAGLAALSAADRTLTDGYGNSADRSILLKTMLDAAGVKSHFVVISSLADTPENRAAAVATPDAGAFDTVRVAAGDFLLGGSDQYTPLEAAPGEGMLRLNLARGAIGTVKALVPTRESTEINLDLKPDGNAEVRVVIRSYGLAAGAENRRFAEFTPEARRRFEVELRQRLGENAVKTGDLTFRLDPHGVAILEYGAMIPNLAPRSGSFRQLELPAFGAFSAAVSTADRDRETPYLRTGRFEAGYRWSITAPAGWRVAALPPGFKTLLPLESVELKSMTDGNRVTVAASLELRPGMTRPENYGALVKLQHELTELTRRVVIYEVPAGKTP